MRKIKLQMQLSVDSFVAGANGELDWMVWDWDDALKKYVTDLTDSIDTILMGRKMADGFINYWSGVITKTDHPEYPFGKKMIDTPKIVFSKTVQKSDWVNTVMASDIRSEINRLKEDNGSDIIVYGGADFVSSLIKENMIDEYHLFTNPAILGNGKTIFSGLLEKRNLKHVDTVSFSCGIVLNRFEPVA